MQRQNRDSLKTISFAHLRIIHKFPLSLPNKILQLILPFPQIAYKLQREKLQEINLHADRTIFFETEHSLQRLVKHELNVHVVLAE